MTRQAWALVVVLVVSTMALRAGQIADDRAVRDFPTHPDPSASNLEEVLAAGKRLFQTRFNILDGAGRPAATGDSKPTRRGQYQTPLFHRVSGPDAGACASCHNQPHVGGAGDFVTNVFQGAHFLDPLNDSIASDVTNERGTTSLFGSGAIEALAREMSEDLAALRSDALARARAEYRPITVDLVTKGVEFGTLTARPDGTYDSADVRGVDPDLVVKPFGVKGVAISLREFTVFALNHHHGIQAEERFGFRRTGVHDFDADGVVLEFSVGQVSALSLFQATLPPPVRLPATSSAEAAEIAAGENLLSSLGCATCHIPSLPLRDPVFLEPNPLNRPGAATATRELPQVAVPLSIQDGTGVFRGEDGIVRVAAFTDLRRHRICDEADTFYCNERLTQDFVATDQFMTSRLWDVGSTDPYGHRGNLTTLWEAIAHHAGEARASRQAFLALPETSQRALIRFLRHLVVPSTPIEPTAKEMRP